MPPGSAPYTAVVLLGVGEQVRDPGKGAGQFESGTGILHLDLDCFRGLAGVRMVQEA